MDNENVTAPMQQPASQAEPMPTSAPSSAKVGLQRHPLYLTTIIAVVLIFIVLVVVYMYVEGSTSVKPQPKVFVNATTTVQAPSTAFAESFLAPYSPEKALPNVTTFTSVPYDTGGACSSVATIKWFAQPGVNVSYTNENFSTLNQSLPFAEYAAVFVVDPASEVSYAAATNSIGVCSPYLGPIRENSTYSYKITQINGLEVHEYTLSNFTNQGLNLTNTYYIGSKPNLYWYFASTVYNGYGLQFGVWGFASSMNQTSLQNQTEQFVTEFMNASAS